VEDGRNALWLSIIDDGGGFDADEEAKPGHRGLANMHARAEALGGTLTIESDPETGTRVTCEVARGDQQLDQGA
jgi:signal transduction histidine kinase